MYPPVAINGTTHTVVAAETIYQNVLQGFNSGMRGTLFYSWGPAEDGSALLPTYFWKRNIMGFQWLCCMLYLLIWNFVYLSITKAIIVGAFAGINARRNALLNDVKERCLICSLPRFELDTHGGGYSHHTSSHHNPWGYLALLCALELGDEDEFTGIESEVAEKVKRNDATFIPVRQCMAIQKVERWKAKKNASVGVSREATNEEVIVMKLKKIQRNLDTPIEKGGGAISRMSLLENKMNGFIRNMEELLKK
jgi:hypothetical protein